ncbi:MAG: hypothetical protein ABF289_08225 [Clostridiales bacterium]
MKKYVIQVIFFSILVGIFVKIFGYIIEGHKIDVRPQNLQI